MNGNVKTIYITAMAFFLTVIPVLVFAQEEEHARSVEAVMQEIRDSQGVTQNKDINPKRVSDDHLAELGEAVMTRNHPEEREHEWMDQMMGGEGSESLHAAHIMMGYAYLTGDNPDWYRGYGPGMMGPVGNGGRGWGMMGPYGGWGMHSFFGFPWWLVLMTVLGLGGAITAVVWGRRSKDRPQENSALEVLKLRLAKGEITQKEYDTLKKKIE